MNKEQVIAYLKVIWPTVYRIINNALYFLIMVVKAIVRIAVEQIKGFKNG